METAAACVSRLRGENRYKILAPRDAVNLVKELPEPPEYFSLFLDEKNTVIGSSLLGLNMGDVHSVLRIVIQDGPCLETTSRLTMEADALAHTLSTFNIKLYDCIVYNKQNQTWYSMQEMAYPETLW